MRQEPDRPNVRALAVTGVAALLVSGAAVLAVGLLQSGRSHQLVPHAPRTEPAAVGRAQIGIVDQRIFGHDPSNGEIQARARDLLEGYGWVDRDAGVARIPIERAMQLVAGGARP